MKKSNNKKQNKQSLMDELQFLGQMASTETALFHQKIAELNSLGVTDMKTVSTLIQEGPMTAGQLAVRLSLTTGAVTNVIDRLEQAGAVKRIPDPNDRRKVIVKANMNHVKKMGHYYESIGKTFESMLRQYSEDQLKFLVDYYRLTIEQTKNEISKLSNKK